MCSPQAHPKYASMVLIRINSKASYIFLDNITLKGGKQKGQKAKRKDPQYTL